MYLENIAKRKKRVMKGKRIGRGYGSGVGGHTSGRGMKGQKSRSGHKSLVAFEGGNVPFYRRMPKYKGFKSRSKENTQVLNLETITENFKADEKVTEESLKAKGLVKKNATTIKILGHGEIDKKITVEGLKVSANAAEKIEKSGGSVK
jgi:large subunit ribosomal protein L15